DHGEGLGEHEENGHGLFVYQQTLHVPLIVATPGAKAGRRTEIVSLADVTPTILDLAGEPPSPAADGRSLRPLLAGEQPLEERPAYAGTHYPRFHFGWSELDSLQDGRYKIIESSDPELYDLAEDPGETRNLAASQRERYLALRRQLTVMRERWAKT